MMALNIRILSCLVVGAICAVAILCNFNSHTRHVLSNSSSAVYTSSSLQNPIHNSTLGFQQIFSTILPERLDRREQLIAAANVSSLSFVFLDGAHDEEVREEAPSTLPRFSFAGPYACAVTHIRAWKKVAFERINTALLTESDVDWDPRIRDQLSLFAVASANTSNTSPDSRALLSYIPFDNQSDEHISPYGDDWDLLWIGHNGAYGNTFHSYTDPTAPPYDKEFEDMTPNVHGSIEFDHSARQEDERLAFYPQFGVGTQGYAISLWGAMKLVALSEKMDREVDVWIARRCADGSIKCISVWPQILADSQSPTNMGVPDDGLLSDEVKGGRTIQYSTRKNVDALREGKGPEEWQANW